MQPISHSLKYKSDIIFADDDNEALYQKSKQVILKGQQQLQRLFQILLLKQKQPHQMIHFFLKLKMDRLSKEQRILSFKQKQSQINLLRVWEQWKKMRGEDMKEETKVEMIQIMCQKHLLKFAWKGWRSQIKRKSRQLKVRSISKRQNQSSLSQSTNKKQADQMSERQMQSTKNFKKIMQMKSQSNLKYVREVKDSKKKKKTEEVSANDLRLKRKVVKVIKQMVEATRKQKQEITQLRQNFLKRQIFFKWYLALEDLKKEAVKAEQLNSILKVNWNGLMIIDQKVEMRQILMVLKERVKEKDRRMQRKVNNWLQEEKEMSKSKKRGILKKRK